MYLRYMTLWFNIHIHYEVTTTIKLVHTSIISHSHLSLSLSPFLLVQWEHNIYALEVESRKFQVYSTIYIFNFYFFNAKNILYWGIANQQCFDSFRGTEKQLSHTNTCIYSSPNSPPIQAAIEWSFLCYMVGLCRLSISNIAVCTYSSQTP